MNSHWTAYDYKEIYYICYIGKKMKYNEIILLFSLLSKHI